MREDRRAVGAPAHLPGMRRHALLRQLAEQARHEAREGDVASRDRVRRARRTLALLLPGRCVCRVLVRSRDRPEGLYYRRLLAHRMTLAEIVLALAGVVGIYFLLRPLQRRLERFLLR